MSVPRLESTDSNGLNGAASFNRYAWSRDEAVLQSSGTAGLGVVACVLFMAGGLYWTASVGLLTFSALTAYPAMVSAGVVLSLLIFGATFWSPRRRSLESATHSPAKESKSAGMNMYDSVTGLPMNRLFVSLLNQALLRAQKHGRQVAVLMIELDQFPRVTGESGESGCHLMYRIQAARVKSALHTTDTVARLGKRTFAVLLDRVTGPDEVTAIAHKIQRTISLPVTLNEHELFLSSRIGIGLSAHNSLEAAALITAATHAVLRARTADHSLDRVHSAGGPSSADPGSSIAA